MAKNKTPGKKPSQKPDDSDQDEKPDDEDADTNDDDGADDDAEEQNRRINAIVTSRVKREMKGVLNQLNTLTEAIGKLSQPKKDETEDDEDEGDQPEAKKTVAKEDPKMLKKMTKLERELADEREARKKAEQAQKDEAEKAKRQEMISHFDSALAEHGITDPILRKAALRHLEDEGRMVRDEETGKPKFKGTDKYGIETNFDPKQGLKQWVLTEGKSFVPAVDTGGSGTGGSTVGNTKLTKGEFGKLTPQQKASIELERASMGLPPMEQS